VGSISFTYTATGTEGRPAQYLYVPMQNWTGAWTLGVHLSTPAAALQNFAYRFVRDADATACWSDSVSFNAGTSDQGRAWTVGVPGFSWPCGNWDHIYFGIDTALGNPPAGQVFTLTFTGSGILPSSGDCAYGTEKKEPLGSILELAPSTIPLLLPPLGGWAIPAIIVAGNVGAIALNTLCAGPPNAPQTIAESDWTTFEPPFHISTAVRKVSMNFRNELWQRFCQCKPAGSGQPPPNQPAQVVWIKPTYYVTTINNTVSNTDIANTLNLLLQIQYGHTYISNTNTVINEDNSTTINEINVTVNDINATLAELHQCVCPDYTHGTVRTDLVGSGVNTAVELAGLEVEITNRPAGGLELEGQPPYLWNMGWLSIMNADGMLDEKRLTRETQVWLPPRMGLATHWTYTLRPGVVITATELPQV